MPVVDKLNEGSDLRPRRDLLRAHALRHLPRVLVNAGYDAVAERMLVRALVIGLQNHALLAGILTLEQDNNLTLLDASEDKRTNESGENEIGRAAC